MGWYLKKSFPFGPLRINLSKSGIGASVGVKGLRVSTGPKGRQINAGREGLYYRASLNPRSNPDGSAAELLEIEPEAVGAPASPPAKDGLAQFIRGFFRGVVNGR